MHFFVIFLAICRILAVWSSNFAANIHSQAVSIKYEKCLLAVNNFAH